MTVNIPIETIHLFPKLHTLLLELLRSLSPADWDAQTVAKKWKVKDVVAHLLDGDLRTLSISRDKFIGDPAVNISSYDDLVSYLNRLNSEWVSASRRLSPDILITLLELSGDQYIHHLKTLDPFAPAIFSVGWAGESTSKNWFHIAREYTEKWHHQQQIRDAVNKPGIITQELFHPFLRTIMRGLPNTFKNVDAAERKCLQIDVTGPGGGSWFLKKNVTWELSEDYHQNADSLLTIDGSVAWKLFTKSWRRDDASKYFSISGETTLAEKALEMVSVMA